MGVTGATSEPDVGVVEEPDVGDGLEPPEDGATVSSSRIVPMAVAGIRVADAVPVAVAVAIIGVADEVPVKKLSPVNETRNVSSGSTVVSPITRIVMGAVLCPEVNVTVPDGSDPPTKSEASAGFVPEPVTA